jgi:predicted methyltransferase
MMCDAAGMTKLMLLWVAVAGCTHDSPAPSRAHAGLAQIDAARAAAIVASPDRVDRDRKIDGHRKPVDLLLFVGVVPGMHVADLGAGAGYSSELMARAVGPTGVVIAQDTPHWDDPGLENIWKVRLGQKVMANTTHVVRGWEQPLPPDAHDLDIVTFVAAYHDVVAEKDDENKLNAAVFTALKPGGVYVVIDNSAKPGTGKEACEPLHRIDEQVVLDEVQRAGFKLVAKSDFMRNPADGRDWNADPGKDPRSHTQDLFVLKFVKPAR